MVKGKGCDTIDPRIRRTRALLQEALEKLLEQKEFDSISVHDVTTAAMVNRATFYDHYADKYALLECLVGTRFQELLEKREVHFDRGCRYAVQAIVLAVSDFLMQLRGPESDRQVKPHMESAMIAVVRHMLLCGLESHKSEQSVSPCMAAAAASWAIYGAVKEWALQPDRCPAEQMAETVGTLVSPMLRVEETTPV